MSMNSHICFLMICAVRMSPPRILRNVKLADPDSSSSMACLAITSLSEACGAGLGASGSDFCSSEACAFCFSVVGAFSLVFADSETCAFCSSAGMLVSGFLYLVSFSIALHDCSYMIISFTLFLFCDSQLGAAASRVSLLLIGVWYDYLVVDELERRLDSSEEVLFYLAFWIARLHHVLHDAVFQ